MIQIEIDGTEYKDFESSFASKSMETFAGEFNFVASNDVSKKLPFSGGEKCRIIVDGTSIINGHIEKITVSYSANPPTHEIQISGRDKSADIIDSNLDSITDIKAPITLKDAIEKVLRGINENGIGVDIEIIDSFVTIEKFNKAEDIISPEAGDDAFDFIQKLARKRQVLLSSDGNGNIVFTQNSGEKYTGVLQNVKGKDKESNNIEDGGIEIDFTEIYNTYKTKSSKNTTTALFSSTSATKLVDQDGIFEDDKIPEIENRGRQFVVESESSSSDLQNEKRSKWEADVRRARAKVATVTVKGHSTEFGEVYAPNKLIQIKDDDLGLDEVMLIESVNYLFDLDNGNKTELTLVGKDSFTLKLDEPLVEKENENSLFL